uniref:Ig-like domain-containing protein n=1 Tax=Zosterops lateralis melanops TaxID=1220523 RepID=A0A8D2P4B0_ZOSLA
SLFQPRPSALLVSPGNDMSPPCCPQSHAVLWNQVTLTCQGLGIASDTTWYKDGQSWGQNRHDHFTVTESGTYTCDRASSGLSPPVTVLNDQLVLQVPARTLLEGDKVTLCCRATKYMSVSRVQFYQDGKVLRGFLRGTELSLSPLHSSRCRCWRVPLTPSKGPPSISAASAPPAPCGPQPPSCTSSTGTGSWWGARRYPHSSWCPL